MQENKPCDGKELICINVDKVYDWIVKEKSFDFSLPTGDYTFTPTPPLGTSFANAVVTCEVTPAAEFPIIIISRENRTFCIDGKNVCLQQLNIRKNFEVTLVITMPNGMRYTTIPSNGTNTNLSFSRCEQVTMCAPEGTDVEITYTDLDCFVCSQGSLYLPAPGGGGGGTGVVIEGLNLSISTCQSIQSTFPVTVEFLAEYCEPRPDLPTSCPTPSRPHPCSTVFPDGGGHCCN